MIEHVSDTARWVAYYRAMETDRPDAIFRDPYARRLAGAEGKAIVDRLPDGRRMAWAMIVRTAVFDELILDRIQHRGATTVLNLACGLDSRPWRLPLPSDLHWIDVDLPGILGYKTAALKAETAGELILIGGAGIANAFMRLDLIDEYRLLVSPVLFGVGTPLFQGGQSRARLTLAEATRLDTGAMLLTYTRGGP